MDKKKKLSQFAFGSARIVAAVNKAIELGIIKFTDSDCFIFREVFGGAIDKKTYLKNLYVYARLNEIVKENQTLFVKDIENAEILGFCKKGESTSYLK